MLNRNLQAQIENSLFRGKVIVLYGPRRVGKTTLVKEILSKIKEKIVYYQGDDPSVQQSFTKKSVKELEVLVKSYKLVVIDEAQKIENIGTILKLLIDNFPEIQFLATGSSSFELANKINEPLTGRKKVFFLYPFSFEEVSNELNPIEKQNIIPELLQFGSYPKVFLSPKKEKIEELNDISQSYLFKDILSFEKLKYPSALESILKALAYQLGSEVSFSSLANLLNLDQFTIQKYIELLEKAFIVFKLNNFTTNKIKEIRQSRKYYFYDLGIRNWLVKNYEDLNFRQDVGAIWENFCILERKKFLENQRIFVNQYFWRNYNQQEIDYLEEYGGKLTAFEMKWSTTKKVKIPPAFAKDYPSIQFNRVSRNNFVEFYSQNA